MSNLVIVAIPDENDRVWKVSSEKVPHLTLLFLGDTDKVANLESIVGFVEHAANQTLRRFYMTVDRRGELGADQADVLFFKKGRYDYKAIRDFRAALLQDNNIKTAYDGATQFEGPWNPHMTLGYPASPAKPDTDNYGFYDVSFTKIAVWVDDFDGPEFLLKDYWDEYDALECVPMDVAMSDISHRLGSEFVLKHFGVRGMRWGVRNSKPPPSAVATSATSRVPQGSKRKTKIDTEGGENHPAHSDAIKVAEARAKLKKSGAAALSNQELRDVANRLQLEGQVAVLSSSKGQKFVSQQFENESKNLARAGIKKAAPHVIKRAAKGAATAATVAALL